MRLMPIALPLALIFAPQVQAQSADRALQLLGTAPAACVVGSPSATQLSNMSFAVGSYSSGRISISQFVDPVTAITREASIDLTLPVVCNASHRVEVRSDNGGLLRAGASSTALTPGGFREFTAYRYRLDWTGRTLEQASDSGPGSLATERPARGDITLRLTTPQGVGPLVAGQYSDVLVIEVLAKD